MKDKLPHTTSSFPLDGFLQRLELAGFSISTRQRLQLWQVLGQFGLEALDEPEQLKYRLCPIIASDAAGQQQFYILFDRYLEDIRHYQPKPPSEPPPQWWEKMPGWVWGVVLLLFLGVCGLGLWFWLREKEPDPVLRAELETPTVVIGDTFTLYNRSAGYDSTTAQFRWELLDAETGALEQSNNNDFHWSTTINAEGDGPDKLIRLIALDAAPKDTFSLRFRLRCAAPPDYSNIIAPKDTAVMAPIQFRLPEAEEEGLIFQWAFGDGDTAEGYAVTHAYEEGGGYEVRLTIRRPEAEGNCAQVLTHQLSIGEERVFLTFKSLKKDTLPLIVYFGTGVWLLLLLLLLPALYFWYRWLRQSPPPIDKERKAQALAQRFAHTDRPPYRIPFRPQDKALRPDAELYRLAQVLRLRQEGLRSELDLPTTIKETIERAGFPNVHFRRTTMPPNYLFLIDEQAPHSHQAQLYRYLLNFLREQDVHLEAFWYKKTPSHFWNARYLKGLSLEQLQRLYPHFRLIVLGDAHALLDPLARERHRVQPALASTYRRWKSRLLLTPLPANDWTYREAALYELLAVFPGDTAGVQAAMGYLETEMEEEDEKAMPDFRSWQATHNQPPQPPETNYRKWNRLSTYEAYFGGRPELYRWFRALMVYPETTWPLTLAIGQEIGAPVSFDNMLLLSRIPYLQGQPMPPRLRLGLLDELDAETERKARQVVAEELKVVAPAVENSHAKRELQTQLAVQQFLLDPEEEENRAVLRHLLEAGALNRREQAALKEALARQTNKAVKLEAFLSEEEEKTASRRPLNADFYRGLLSTALVLLLAILLGIFNGSSTLQDLFDGENQPNALFFDSRTAQDSAVFYNNRAVTAWDSLLQQQMALIPADLEAIAADLDRAQKLRNDEYPLAAANAAGNDYHRGLLHYHDYLQIKNDDQLRLAERFFQTVQANDRMSADARHALGLIDFYRNDLTAARAAVAELQVQGYFDTLQLQPNLRTLVFPSEGRAILSNCIAPPAVSLLSNGTLCRGDSLRLRLDPAAEAVDYYLVRWGDGQADTLREAGIITHAYQLPAGNIEVDVLAFGNCEEEGQVYNVSALPLVLGAAPRAQIRPTQARGCPPLEVNFAALSSGADEYSWDFGNGQQSTEANPAFTYTDPGTYTVTFIATNDCGADTLVLQDAVTVLSPEACAETIALNGQVFDAVTGLGLPAAGIQAGEANRITDAQLRSTGGPFRDSTNAEGRFTLELIPAETRQLQILVRAKGYQDTLLRVIPTTEPLRVRLQPLPASSPDCYETLRAEGEAAFADGRYEEALVKFQAAGNCPDLKAEQEAGLAAIIDRTRSQLAAEDPIQKLQADMAPVAGGIFTMGCLSEERDGGCDSDEKPAHEVTLDSFYLGRYEVTQAQWRAVMGSDPPELYNKGCDECPVEGVSWNDIQDFLQLLNKLTGRNYRLPTEAEWEFAARGGNQSRGYRYSGSNNIDEVAWYFENYRDNNNYGEQQTTHPVGQKKANELGLFDMSGNVWEWCQDWYRGKPSTAQRNPKGPESGSSRVYRGGGWFNNPRFCRAANRDDYAPTLRYNNIGFRLARSSR